MQKKSIANFFFLSLLGNFLFLLTRETNAEVLVVDERDLAQAKNTLAPTSKFPTTMPTAGPTEEAQKVSIVIHFDDKRILAANSQARTPNLDALEAEGLTFKNARSSHPVCGPSREMELIGDRRYATKNFQQSYPVAGAYSYAKVVRDNGPAFVGFTGKVIHQLPADLVLDVMYANNETSTPNTIRTAGNSDCTKGQIGCVIPKTVSADYQVVKRALQTAKQCAQQLNSGATQQCLLAIGLKHAHIEWAAYRSFSYKYLPVNTDEPVINFDGFSNLLRHLECDDMYIHSIKVNGLLKKIVSGSIKYPSQITNNRSLTQAILKSYLNALNGVDTMVGEYIAGLRAIKLQNGQSLWSIAKKVVLSDHGFSMGEQKLWCKQNPTDEAVRIPFTVVWPGITDQPGYPRYASELVASEDLFCFLVEFHLGTNFLKTYTHPNGIKPNCVSFLGSVINPAARQKQWSFSNVYRCQSPNVMQTDPCTTPECDSTPINWVLHSTTAILGSQLCTYTGAWPWKQITIGCSKPTWWNQPKTLSTYGTQTPVIDLFNSHTVFVNENGKAVQPIQEELHCHGEQYLYGEGDNPSVVNLVDNPAYAAFRRNAITAIIANNQPVGGIFPFKPRLTG